MRGTARETRVREPNKGGEYGGSLWTIARVVDNGRKRW